MYPKSRVDALTDGLFAVAMTILVLDLRLPDSFAPDQSGLAHTLEPTAVTIPAPSCPNTSGNGHSTDTGRPSSRATTALDR
jgi:Endosomal/lysosomal potassium channel TMEM175